MDLHAEKVRLVSEIYKLEVIDWNGRHKLKQEDQEEIIKYFSPGYVKSYNQLVNILEWADYKDAKSLVTCLWYNYWSSTLIEDIFNNHKRVVPAIGNIKRTNFFIENIPIDLKITYFPEGFMDLCRKEKGLRSEFNDLKKIAQKNNIRLITNSTGKKLYFEYLSRLSESQDSSVISSMNRFFGTRNAITTDTINNKSKLINWLNNNQGERKLASSNRLHLVLVDKEQIENSWKLRRNIDYLKLNISNYIDNFKLDNNNNGFSDIIFIIK